MKGNLATNEDYGNLSHASKMTVGIWLLNKGSHRQFKHPTKPGRVTVSGKPNDDVALGTKNSVFKQAGWK
jgi:hypothetical protein